MTEHGHDWLTERAYRGTSADDAYSRDEAYPGERDDLRDELRHALAGCPNAGADPFARTMTIAVELNALPVLRAVVSLWRDAYRDVLVQMGALSDSTEPCAALTGEERSRLVAVRSRLWR